MKPITKINNIKFTEQITVEWFKTSVIQSYIYNPRPHSLQQYMTTCQTLRPNSMLSPSSHGFTANELLSTA